MIILCLNRQIYFLMNCAYSCCMICFVKQRWHHTINEIIKTFFLNFFYLSVFWRIKNKLEVIKYRRVFLTVVQFKRRPYKSSDLQHINIFWTCMACDNSCSIPLNHSEYTLFISFKTSCFAYWKRNSSLALISLKEGRNNCSD